MVSDRSRIVTDPLGNPKRRQNLSAMHQADEPEIVRSRRDAAVARLRAAREALAGELETVTPAEAFAGDEWSALHVLWHFAAGHTHLELARLIAGGEAELPPERDAAAELRAAADGVLRQIDEWIAFSESLTPEQLVTHARRGNRDYYVVGMVESTAEHTLDHLDHIRQIRERVRTIRPPA